MPLSSYRIRLRPVVSYLIMFIFMSTITPQRLSVWYQNPLYMHTQTYKTLFHTLKYFNSLPINKSFCCRKRDTVFPSYLKTIYIINWRANMWMFKQKFLCQHSSFKDSDFSHTNKRINKSLIRKLKFLRVIKFSLYSLLQ